VFRDLADGPRHLGKASNTSHAAPRQHPEPDRALGREARVAAGVLGLACHLHLVAEETPVHEHPAHDEGADGQKNGRVDPGAFLEEGQQGVLLELLGLGEIEAVRILPGAMHQPGNHQLGDVDQHQAREDLIGIEAGLQESGDRGPEHAAQGPRQHHGGEEQGTRAVLEMQGDPAPRQGPDEQLSFSADVPDVGSESHGEAHGAKHQRRGLEQQFRDAISILDGIEEEDLEAFQRVLAQHREEQETAGQHQEDRQDGGEVAHHTGWLRARLELKPHENRPFVPRRPATCRSSRCRSLPRQSGTSP